jgi:hypothetical protein
MVYIQYECLYLDTVNSNTAMLNYGATNVPPIQKDQHLLSSKRTLHGLGMNKKLAMSPNRT